MTTPTRPETPPELIPCSVCRKEIPLSSALTPNGAEYIAHFCGIECYQEFLEAQKKSDAAKPPAQK